MLVDLAPDGPHGQALTPRIHMLPNLVSRLAIVPTDGIEMEDDHHFDYVGHREWARRALALMKANGWFQW